MVPAVSSVSGRSAILRLPAVPVRRHHHPAGDAGRDAAALVPADQVQEGVDARPRARTGDHRVLVDVQDGGVDLGRREQLRQLRRVPPVRGAAPVVEQAGRPQHERARAHAQHPGAPCDGRPQGGQQRLGEVSGPPRDALRLRVRTATVGPVRDTAQ